MRIHHQSPRIRHPARMASPFLPPWPSHTMAGKARGRGSHGVLLMMGEVLRPVMGTPGRATAQLNKWILRVPCGSAGGQERRSGRCARTISGATAGRRQCQKPSRAYARGWYDVCWPPTGVRAELHAAYACCLMHALRMRWRVICVMSVAGAPVLSRVANDGR